MIRRARYRSDEPLSEDNLKVGSIIFSHKKQGLRFKIPFKAISGQGGRRTAAARGTFKKAVADHAEDDFAQAYVDSFRSRPVSLTLYFFLTEKNSTKLDVDNLCKICIDGLKGVLFDDDSQVMRLTAHKEIVQDHNWQWIGVQVQRWRSIKYRQLSSLPPPSKRKKSDHEPRWLQEYKKKQAQSKERP